jgi:hypothetical protein
MKLRLSRSRRSSIFIRGACSAGSPTEMELARSAVRQSGRVTMTGSSVTAYYSYKRRYASIGRRGESGIALDRHKTRRQRGGSRTATSKSCRSTSSRRRRWPTERVNLLVFGWVGGNGNAQQPQLPLPEMVGKWSATKINEKYSSKISRIFFFTCMCKHLILIYLAHVQFRNWSYRIGPVRTVPIRLYLIKIV